MNIGIIGQGFVGSAIREGLKNHYDVLTYDLDESKSNSTHEKVCKKSEIIFVCVPTPMRNDSSQDISILTNVLDEIKKLNLKSLTILKSTVLPNHIQKIESLIPRFVYNPEFLREKYATQDFIDSKLIVFGGSADSCKDLANIYNHYTKCICKDYVYTDAISASLIKYSINSFLATKVVFFNAK